MCFLHRLNMELDLQIFLGSSVQCTVQRNSPPSPHLGSQTRALLVSHDRRHLFVTPYMVSYHPGEGSGSRAGMYSRKTDAGCLHVTRKWRRQFTGSKKEAPPEAQILYTGVKPSKGVWHEIFGFWFFSKISFPHGPEYSIGAISIFLENSRIYLNVKVSHRCQWPR